MTDILTSVPETDDLDAQLNAMREADREEPQEIAEEGGEQPEPEEAQADAEGGEESKQAEQELEPLTAEEWKERHDNLQKALHAERGKRKESDEYKRKFAEIEDRLSRLTPAERKEAVEEAEKRPNAAEDPLAALDYVMGKVSQYEQLEAERAQQNEQAQAQQKQLNELADYGRRSEEAFRETAPDYDDAAQYYMNQRVGEISAIYGVSEQQAQQAFVMELRQSMSANMQSGRNVAEAVYSAAKARGWTGKSEPETKAEPKRYDKMKEGQKAAKSLSGGGRVKSGPSIESLIGDDEDPLEALHSGDSEFDRKFAEYARSQR